VKTCPLYLLFELPTKKQNLNHRIFENTVLKIFQTTINLSKVRRDVNSPRKILQHRVVCDAERNPILLVLDIRFSNVSSFRKSKINYRFVIKKNHFGRVTKDTGINVLIITNDREKIRIFRVRFLSIGSYAFLLFHQ